MCLCMCVGEARGLLVWWAFDVKCSGLENMTGHVLKAISVFIEIIPQKTSPKFMRNRFGKV